MYALSLIGYAATLGLAIALVAALFGLALTFLGVPMPWSR
jgi:hypothetical protein